MILIFELQQAKNFSKSNVLGFFPYQKSRILQQTFVRHSMISEILWPNCFREVKICDKNLKTVM